MELAGNGRVGHSRLLSEFRMQSRTSRHLASERVSPACVSCAERVVKERERHISRRGVLIANIVVVQEQSCLSVLTGRMWMCSEPITKSALLYTAHIVNRFGSRSPSFVSLESFYYPRPSSAPIAVSPFEDCDALGFPRNDAA